MLGHLSTGRREAEGTKGRLRGRQLLNYGREHQQMSHEQDHRQ